MPNDGNPKYQNALDLITQLKNGQINPEVLDKTTKIDCTAFLQRQGYTREQIAQVLKTSDRTITRYYNQIRKRHRLNISPEFTAEYMGELVEKMIHSSDYLIRLSAGKDAKVSEKIQATKEASQISFELTKIMLMGGFLPTKADDDLANSDVKPVTIKVVGKKPKKGPNDQASGNA